MMRFGLVLAAALILGHGPGAAQPMPPLPPPRPSDAPAPPLAVQSEPPQRAPQDGAQTVTEPDPCLAQLKAAGFDIEVAEQPSTTNELCRIDVPVRLKAVPVWSRPGTMVRLSAQPILACRFADRFGYWVGDLVAPLVAGSLNTELKSIQTGPGFECRNRNGAATGKLSAHAEGLAIDIAAFELANGSTLRVKPDGDTPPNPAFASLRTAACGWFTTILGPGSDAAHADHLHVDMQQHGSSDRYRICQ
ncbi:extensin family protein [Microvirga sp. CF3062]|uniref:extensin-like domain-containing protein n=1 Tax=Microvirga sp. CF3062 TaxID=3110182 RepID=UPI002E76EF80|nr:extensin family protein [Microvirga sp. CF3062]MEE1658283.1 extensin family protein [Microvirga sp. CF3062]